MSFARRGRPPGSGNPEKRKRAVADTTRVVPISKSVQTDLIPKQSLNSILNSSQKTSARSSQNVRSSQRLSQAKSIVTASQDEAAHYTDLLCVVCFMPMCIHHSLSVPDYNRRSNKDGSQRVYKRWTLQNKDIENSKLSLNRPTFVPCNHEGACDPSNGDCTCSEYHIHCEKSCGCPPDCPRRWKGCQCRSGKSCSGEKCVCVNNNRECDPDLCLRCGADEQLDPINRRSQDTSLAPAGLDREEVRQLACQNVILQLGEEAMTVVGPTSMPFPGHGLFASVNIKKGDFIGEYKGEIITDAESDEKGKMYDKMGFSYLYQPNETHVIDGTNYSNKIRFINHSKIDMNCTTKVLFVNGVHRVAFTATEDIDAGEELLINYGDKFKFKAIERGDVVPISTPGSDSTMTRSKETRKANRRIDTPEDESSDSEHAIRERSIIHLTVGSGSKKIQLKTGSNQHTGKESSIRPRPPKFREKSMQTFSSDEEDLFQDAMED